ncbi:MAG: ATP synthase subunit I [Gemmatimonadales bacterium]|nr:ATP synthase subunit I [Gemmatimonadales bacterium]
MLVGIVATAATAGVAWLASGTAGAIGAATAGVVAIALSLLAVRLVGRTGRAPTVDQLMVYGIGVVLRMLGVLIVGVLVMRDAERFPPLPTALGYLGVVLPLLYMETRQRS